MQDLLNETIASIKGDGTIRSFDEAKVKNGVILKILSNLGWNAFNVNEVKPEHNVGSRRVDFALIISDRTKVFIEAKRPSENLEPHQQQLLEYSFQEGVNLSVLTNGLTWWFYLPLMEGSWEQRRFYTVDILEQSSEDAGKKLIEILSKENIESGKAIKNAEGIYQSQKKNNILRETLPKAWLKIISEPNDLLIDLIIETTERLSGFRPDNESVADFIHSKIKSKLQPKPTTETDKNQTASQTQKSIPKTSSDDYINTRVERFRFLGTEYYPRTWQELLKTIAEEIYRGHRTEFEKCLSLRGSRMIYFSKNKNELRYPKNISGSDFYFEAQLNANSIVRRARDLMGLFGYTDSDLEITVQ